MGIFDGFGGGAPPPTYQTNNTNPPHAGGVLPPGTVILQNAQQAYNAAITNAAQPIGLGQVMQENTTLLRELKEELLPLKKWLIATYPDIYKQYHAVETLRELGKGESK